MDDRAARGRHERRVLAPPLALTSPAVRGTVLAEEATPPTDATPKSDE
jgi:hypothetical protein